MTPDQLLAQLSRRPPEPVYLFLGPEAYQRGLCRRALIERTLPAEDRQSGFIRHDLQQTPLAAVLDDALSFSLFSPCRLLWVSSAEAVLPRGRAASEDDKAAGELLARYLANPTPGVTLVFDSSRFGFEGEDKARNERIRKFFSAIPAQVDFAPYKPPAARRLAGDLARRAGLDLDQETLDWLVDSLDFDAARIEVEIEKLRLRAGTGGKLTRQEIEALVPDARATTIFALVAALGRGRRAQSLELLDRLVREGEYLPLALSFLATQFRHALVAKEAGLRDASDIQAYFSRPGVQMWRSRAEQIQETVTAFRTRRLLEAVEETYRADKSLRDARPDDRIILERLILALS